MSERPQRRTRSEGGRRASNGEGGSSAGTNNNKRSRVRRGSTPVTSNTQPVVPPRIGLHDTNAVSIGFADKTDDAWQEFTRKYENCKALLREKSAQNRSRRKALETRYDQLEQKHGGTSTRRDDKLLLNVGGATMRVMRSTLLQFPDSLLSGVFSGRWEGVLPRDSQGRIFLDLDPKSFGRLTAHLSKIRDADGQPALMPEPLSLDEEKMPYFSAMLQLFGFDLSEQQGLVKNKTLPIPIHHIAKQSKIISDEEKALILSKAINNHPSVKRLYKKRSPLRTTLIARWQSGETNMPSILLNRRWQYSDDWTYKVNHELRGHGSLLVAKCSKSEAIMLLTMPLDRGEKLRAIFNSRIGPEKSKKVLCFQDNAASQFTLRKANDHDIVLPRNAQVTDFVENFENYSYLDKLNNLEIIHGGIKPQSVTNFSLTKLKKLTHSCQTAVKLTASDDLESEIFGPNYCYCYEIYKLEEPKSSGNITQRPVWTTRLKASERANGNGKKRKQAEPTGSTAWLEAKFDCFPRAVRQALENERSALKTEEIELGKAEERLARETLLVEGFFAARDADDIIDINVCGEQITTWRSTLQLCPESALARKFDAETWPQIEAELAAGNGVVHLEHDPQSFLLIINQLRLRVLLPQATENLPGPIMPFGGGAECNSELNQLVKFYFPGCEGFVMGS